MHLFWRNGYENTSMQMLEKEMGINKFSIYASFGNKRGVFIESLKSYKAEVSATFEKFKNGSNGIEDIKQFFYDSVAMVFQEGCQNGCFVTNTYNEFSKNDDKIINEEMTTFMDNLKSLIIEKLKLNSSKDEATIIREANYLVLAKHGLAAASRVNSKKEIEDYIEITFNNL